MKIIYMTLVLGLLFPSIAYEAPQSSQASLTVKEYISIYSEKYGANEAELLKVAKCESKFKINAIHYNDGGKGKHSFGVFQYQKSTFNAFSKLKGEKLDYYSYADQVKLTAMIFATYPHLKNHWSCWKGV